MQHLAYDKGQDDDKRRRMGLVVLQTDETLEPEVMSWLDTDKYVLHISRIPNAQSVTPETLAAMEKDLPRSVSLFPDAASLSVVGYGCTSASMVLGEEAVHRAVAVHRPGIPVTNPLTALKAWLDDQQIRHLGILTPYIPSVTQGMIDDLHQGGYHVEETVSFFEERDDAVARIPLSAVREGLYMLARNDKCHALFASCTNLRTKGLLEEVSHETGLPVISSNAALWWHMTRLTENALS